MPIISTFGAASARGFGANISGGGGEAPGDWYASQSQNAQASYVPVGYATVSVTVVGVNGSNQYANPYFGGKGWCPSGAPGTPNSYPDIDLAPDANGPTANWVGCVPGEKVGKASKVVKSIDPSDLSFRTPDTSAVAGMNVATYAWRSGTAANVYSGCEAVTANVYNYTGAPGGAACVAYNANQNNVHIVGAGGAASGRPDRNSTSYNNEGSHYNRRSDADDPTVGSGSPATSNANIFGGGSVYTNNNGTNGENNGGGRCYYTSGGSGGGEQGGGPANNTGNYGGYSGLSKFNGATLTAGNFLDVTVGQNTNIGYAKVSWS